MKKLILIIAVGISCFNCFSQKKDSVYIQKHVDEMEDKTYYFASRNLIISNETKTKGFKISATIGDDIQCRSISCSVVDIGGCEEEDELIIMFADSTKIALKQWNKFNCEGRVYIDLSEEDVSALSTKKLLKVKLTNGRSFESFAKRVDKSDSDYFIQLFEALKNKKIKTLKVED